MPYGHGAKDSQIRMLELMVGDLPSGTRQTLAQLRLSLIDAHTCLARAVFVQEPLLSLPSNDEMEAALLVAQKGMTGLLKKYVEKARVAVTTHVRTLHNSYGKNLYGRLAHCDEEIPVKARRRPKKGQPQRRYWYVPVEIQDDVTPAELSALRQKVEDLGYQGALDLIRRVCLEGDATGLTEHEAAIIREIHHTVQARHHCPEYGRDPRFVAQIHLDADLLGERFTGPVTLEKLQRGLKSDNWLLAEDSGRRWRCFLHMANPTPRAPYMDIPIAVDYRLKRRLDRWGRAAPLSLVVEIGRDTLKVKLCMEQAAVKITAALLNQYDHIIGVDANVWNTVGVTIVRRDRDIDQQLLETIHELTTAKNRRFKTEEIKQWAADYFATHHHPKDRTVDRLLISGRRFVARANRHYAKIDDLRAQIDRSYEKLYAIRKSLLKPLGLGENDPITLVAHSPDPLVQRLIEKFFNLYASIQGMKRERRRLYDQISGLKKTWFGHVAHWVRDIAKRYNAFVVREDLSVKPESRGSAKYQGPVNNQKLERAAPVQYLKKQAEVLSWDGVPDVKVPTPYTSQTCIIHSLTDGKMRDGPTFACPPCGVPRHSDLNASDNMGYYLLLRPKPKQP